MNKRKAICPKAIALLMPKGEFLTIPMRTPDFTTRLLDPRVMEAAGKALAAVLAKRKERV